MCSGHYWTLDTTLAENFLAGVGNLAARLERLFTFATGEALLMICVAQGGDDLALHVQVTGGTLGTVQLLVVQGAVVGAILREKAARRQRFVAFGALEARFVEISVRNTQHLAGALFLAFAALDLAFTHFAGYPKFSSSACFADSGAFPQLRLSSPSTFSTSSASSHASDVPPTDPDSEKPKTKWTFHQRFILTPLFYYYRYPTTAHRKITSFHERQ